MSVLLISAFSSHDPFQFGWQMSDDSQMSVSFLSFGFPSVSFAPLGYTVPLHCFLVGGLSGCQDLHQMQSRFVHSPVKYSEIFSSVRWVISLFEGHLCNRKN